MKGRRTVNQIIALAVSQTVAGVRKKADALAWRELAKEAGEIAAEALLEGAEAGVVVWSGESSAFSVRCSTPGRVRGLTSLDWIEVPAGLLALSKAEAVVALRSDLDKELKL